MTDKTAYWLDTATYDYDTAKAMLDTKRYLYVGFMCHQTIEKAMKAVIAESGEFPPKVHNLIELAKRNGIYNKMSDCQQNLLSELNPLNIESRYPTYLEKMNEMLNETYCNDLYKRVGELFLWIKEQL